MLHQISTLFSQIDDDNEYNNNNNNVTCKSDTCDWQKERYIIMDLILNVNKQVKQIQFFILFVYHIF